MIRYINNKDLILKQKQEYRKRPEVIARTNKLARDRRKDPEYKLMQNISRAINYALKNMNSGKNNYSIWSFLNYSSDDLIKHLESQFQPWMSWDNYGVYKIGGPSKWHLDHIMPQSKLPYDSMEHSNFIKCWALSNLQPLEAKANISKGCK